MSLGTFFVVVHPSLSISPVLSWAREMLKEVKGMMPLPQHRMAVGTRMASPLWPFGLDAHFFGFRFAFLPLSGDDAIAAAPSHAPSCLFCLSRICPPLIISGGGERRHAGSF